MEKLHSLETFLLKRHTVKKMLPFNLHHHRQTGRKADRQTDSMTETERLRQRKADRQTDSVTDRETKAKTDR